MTVTFGIWVIPLIITIIAMAWGIYNFIYDFFLGGMALAIGMLISVSSWLVWALFFK